MITRLVLQYGSRAFVALADKILKKYDLFEVREAAPLVLEHLARKGTPFHSEKSGWLQEMVVEILPGFRPESARICQAQPEEIQMWLSDRVEFLDRAMKPEGATMPLYRRAFRRHMLSREGSKLKGRSADARAAAFLVGRGERLVNDRTREASALTIGPAQNELSERPSLVEEDGEAPAFVNPPLETYFEVSPEQREVAQQQQRDLFAKWRDQILANETFYTAKELAEQRGAGQKYSAQNALNFRENGKIFGIFVNGKYRYPKFQFSVFDSQPLDVVSAVIRQVPQESRQWPLLLWFWSPSTLLSGKTPRELISERMSESEKQQILRAVEDAFSPPLP